MMKMIQMKIQVKNLKKKEILIIKKKIKLKLIMKKSLNMKIIKKTKKLKMQIICKNIFDYFFDFFIIH